LRGEVLTFDEATGLGFILGDDGARYSFTKADVQPPSVLERSQRVDFIAEKDWRAQQIIAMRPPLVTSAMSGRGKGSGVFDLGRVMQRTFSAIKQNAAVFFGAAAVLIGVPSILKAAGQSAMLSDGEITGVLVMMVGVVLNFVGLYLLQGMVVKAAVNGFNGKATAFSDAFNVGVQNFLPLLGLAIIASIGMLLGFFLLFVPGVILSVMWSVGSPAVVVEKRGVLESLQRSRELTKGYRWQVFGLLVIYVILSWIIGAAIGGLSLATGGTLTGGTPNLAVNLITEPLVSILSGVVASAGVAALYHELRSAKEGVGSEELASIFD
jgi:cold shock CspA family protein